MLFNIIMVFHLLQWDARSLQMDKKFKSGGENQGGVCTRFIRDGIAFRKITSTEMERVDNEICKNRWEPYNSSLV